jgi:glycosyltransferase involved in cell wall biosynthesis
MDVFKYILCVSPNTIHAVKKEVPGISDKLILTTLGVDENNFPKSVFNRQSLKTLGYFSHFDSTELHGMNTKRGHLAATVSQRTQTPITIKGDLPFQVMDQMYKNIDVYLMTSIYEGASTSLLEAGICGIPIIAAPAGLAPQLLQNGGGVMTETFSEEEYIYMASNVIDFWKKNPNTFCRESKIIRENTFKFYSWNNVKGMWIDGIKKFINSK